MQSLDADRLARKNNLMAVHLKLAWTEHQQNVFPWEMPLLTSAPMTYVAQFPDHHAGNS